MSEEAEGARPASNEESNPKLEFVSKLCSIQSPELIYRQGYAYSIPSLQATNYKTTEPVYGIRAATLALYARISHNLDLEVEAAKLYSNGLVAQQQELHLAMSTESYSPCCHKAIGAAVTSSYFESVITTVPMGWMQHYAAAIKMFEIAGPKNCQMGLMHKFFRSIRVATMEVKFTTALLADEPSVLAADEWCTVPFDRIPKTPFDKLVDILLQLPSSGLLRRQLGSTAKRLLDRLHDFWTEYKEEVDLAYDQHLGEISSASTFTNKNWIEEHQVSSTQQSPFKSASDGYFTSMYDSGKIITLGFLATVAVGVTWYNYNREIVMHGASILASAAYCESLGVFNVVSFSMAFPIKLVCLLRLLKSRGYSRGMCY
ncbi:hypothetical protein BGZ57DRAFT_983527 [Hyaloscypha finlandica]|nr:hypothetical protein BGZ57DRAFT_983527 [Hyaloscypha finlandica]